MYWKVPAEHGRAAVVWEFARDNDQFQKLANDRSTCAEIEQRMSELVSQSMQSPLPAPQQLELRRLTEKWRAIPEVLLQRPLGEIWLCPAFPSTPWLSLPSHFKQALASAFAPQSLTGFKLAAVACAGTVGFVEHVKKQLDFLKQSLPPDSEWPEVENPKAVVNIPMASHEETYALAAVDWRAPDDRVLEALKAWLKQNRGGRRPERGPATGPERKRMKALLLGLGLDRLKRCCACGWEDVHTALKQEPEGAPFGDRETRHGTTYHPHYRRSQARAERFRDNLLKELEEIACHFERGGLW